MTASTSELGTHACSTESLNIRDRVGCENMKFVIGNPSWDDKIFLP